MAIQVEIWQKDVQEEIFKENTFLRKSFNADQYVVQGKIVHIPQSGGSGNVVKNRTSLPANVRKRNDTDVVYALDAYTTDPVLIPNAEQYELSYDKRNSVIGEDKAKLNETIAEEVLYDWTNSPLNTTSLPAGSVFKTSGDAIAATAAGATGNRKKATLTDLQRMKTFFKTKKQWFEGQMNALLTPQMEADLFPANDVVTATYLASVSQAEREAGVIAKVQGWNIMTRSTVLVTASTFALKAPGAAGAAGDNEASLFWYNNAVEVALGEVTAFEKIKDPQFYGDVYSFEVRMGARARRANYDGIAVLTQDVAA
ncbi:MAG: hypothetical protein EOO42_01110 [Flavobacteriales bacterium]|nr:MAG: hypothetical protein EOO42_01110 [Flavobacteriales bacterium]